VQPNNTSVIYQANTKTDIQQNSKNTQKRNFKEIVIMMMMMMIIIMMIVIIIIIILTYLLTYSMEQSPS
jgi:type III secretory pathway lipoprotein EscJ